MFGHVEHAIGDANAARDRFTRSVEGFRALAIPWGIGNSLNGMAKVALEVGDAAEAERLLDEATSVLRQLVRGSWRWCCIVAPFWRCGAGTPMKRSRWCVKASRSSGSSMTSSRSCTRWSLLPLRRYSRATTLWAARILGARDAVTERTGATIADKWVHALGDQAEREVRARLGPDRWARAYAAGRSDFDRCVAEGHRKRAQPHGVAIARTLTT